MNRAITADDFRIAGEAREFETGRVLQAAVIAAAIAASLNLVVYFAARAAGVTFTGRFSPTAPETVVAMTDVLGASIVWVIPAIIGLLVFNRFTARPSKG